MLPISILDGSKSYGLGLKDAWEYISKGTGSFWCVGINKTEKKRDL